MSRLALTLPKKHKFKVREHSRCPLCGRPRSYMRKFDMCRLCFRSPRTQWRYPRSHQVELVRRPLCR